MLSNVYFSDRLWRILKSLEPRFEAKDSSSSMMSLGTLTFFPRSISTSGNRGQKDTLPSNHASVSCNTDRTSCNWRVCVQYIFWKLILLSILPVIKSHYKLYSNSKKQPWSSKKKRRKKSPHYMDCWLGTPANMMNEELSPLVIHSCLVLVLWLALRASYCMLIMEMS